MVTATAARASTVCNSTRDRLEAKTSGADLPTEFEDHVSDRLHITSEDSPSRIKTSTEITAFSETVDLQVGRGSYTEERERQSMRRTPHPEDQVGGHDDADPLGCHRDDRPPSGILVLVTIVQ